MSVDLAYASAGDLTRSIARRELTSVQVTRAYLARIDAYDDAVNALNLVRRDAALAEAARADALVRDGGHIGPLHGLPITLKDGYAVAGVRSTFGAVPHYRWYVPRHDSAIVARLRAAGAIVLGRSNVPFMSLDWQSANAFFGASKNPFDLQRTPGGSSGGAAAALASGFTALELGTDLGGSIRYPAHCCGVFGLRPSEGALPLADIGPTGVPQAFEHIITAGPMARSLEDVQLMWQVLSGKPRRPALERPLRIAVTMQAMGVRPDHESSEAIAAYVARLQRDGHTIVATAPADIDFAEAYALNCLISGYACARILPPLLDHPLGRTLFGLYMFRFKTGDGPFYQGARRGLHADAATVANALARRAVLRERIDRFFESFDLWLLPVAPTVAIRRQAFGHPIAIDDERVPYALGLGAFTVSTATLGTPALSIPIARGALSGMPIGVQLHARYGADEALLAMAEALPSFTSFVDVRL